MRRTLPARCLVQAAGLSTLLALGAEARASGYWNVPSTFCQCMNVGWGAGYHAPLVLGPVSCREWCDHNEVRLPYSPASPHSCRGGCGWSHGQPSRLESAVVPPSVAAPPSVLTPSVPVGKVFAPPIER